ncbi:hypothetical protein ABGV42_01460 [Paenibacillus pabuli]
MINIEISKVPSDLPSHVVYRSFGRMVLQLEGILSNQVGRNLTNAEREHLAGSFQDLLNTKYTCTSDPSVYLYCQFHPSTSREAHSYEVGYWKNIPQYVEA